MHKFKGYLSFPQLFEPDFARNAAGQPVGDKKRYSMDLLLPPNDPQIPTIQSLVDTELANAFPSGAPAGLHVCFSSYDDKFKGKSYYDPSLSGYYVLSATRREVDGRPHLVSLGNQPIVDRGEVYSGAECWLGCGITFYQSGKQGIGCWLNGIMVTGNECPLGRFDGKPDPDHMFDGVGEAAPAETVAPPPATTVAPPPAKVAAYTMTDKAENTREVYLASGWTDELLIEHELMLPPGGVAPSFA